MGKSSDAGDGPAITETPDENATLSYEDKLQYVNAISKPMASRKLTKKIHKLIKKGKDSRDS